jgi:hypothetical protein
VKAVLLTGCGPDDVLNALRDWTGYGGYFAAQGRTYGVPLALHLAAAGGQSRVTALINLLEVTGLTRRRNLDLLRSPISVFPVCEASFRPPGAMIHRREGAAEAQRRQRQLQPADEEDETPTPFDRLVEYTHTALNAFFYAVTPPEEGSIETYALAGKSSDVTNLTPKTKTKAIPYTPTCRSVRAAASASSSAIWALERVAHVLRGMIELRRCSPRSAARRRRGWTFDGVKTIVSMPVAHGATSACW